MFNLFKTLRRENGQALVEMALILPILILLFWGIVEFGRLGHSYLTVTHAAREGARLGVVGMSDAEITSEVGKRTVSLPDGVSVSVIPAESFRYAGSEITVQVDYYLEFYMPVMVIAFDNPFLVSAVSIMRVE